MQDGSDYSRQPHGWDPQPAESARGQAVATRGRAPLPPLSPASGLPPQARLLAVAVAALIMVMVIASTINPALSATRARAYPPPDVTISADDTNAQIRTGDSMQFVANVVAGRDLTYVWSFGDGTSASGQDASHVYDNFGQYDVRLDVVDGMGQSTSATTSVTVLPGPPHARFTSAPRTDDPSTITFDASGSSGTNLSYQWNFGDGSTDSSGAVQTSHSYASSGTYNVTLTVVDAASQQDSATAQVKSIAALGLLLLDSYCQAHGYADASLDGSTAYDWYCVDDQGNRTRIDLTDACKWQYGRQDVEALGDADSPYSWKCYPTS